MEEFSESQIEYPVSILEGIAITGGAVLLIATGLVGLGFKALGNAFNPERAEAIARSLMTYDIPGGSSGFFGTNIGGGKMAVVASTATIPAKGTPSSPKIELFLARMPITEDPKVDSGADSSPAADVLNNELFSGFSFSYPDPAAFQIQNARTEQKLLCDAFIPVEIQQGLLTMAEGVAPLPAVKYQVNRPIEAKHDVIVISALGPDAIPQANQVFKSLSCK